jgi:hypothetical protein
MSGTYLTGGGTKVPSEAERLEHAQIEGVHGKKVFPIDLPPTGQTNPSQVLAYTGPNLTSITKTINGVDYQQTLTYDGSNNLIGISAWVKL